MVPCFADRGKCLLITGAQKLSCWRISDQDQSMPEIKLLEPGTSQNVRDFTNQVFLPGSRDGLSVRSGRKDFRATFQNYQPMTEGLLQSGERRGVVSR